MTCDCGCHPTIADNCWCPNCMDNHIDFNKVMEQMNDCEYCGDGIGGGDKGMNEHIEWCKPMIEKNIRGVDRKYRPKFQWPLKLKDYGDESLK